MKHIFFVTISLLLCSVYGQTQEIDSHLNLDFEQTENNLPVNWHGIQSGDTLNYTVSLDSISAKSGKYAISIAFTGKSLNSKNILFVLPSYEGKKITVSGYIKTENITEGYAGLRVMTVHLNGIYTMALNDKVRITGTTDWEKYEITLDLSPANTKYIMIDGILLGNGTMWLDDLTVTIDEKDIQQLKPYQQEPFPAESDNEFNDGSQIIFSELNNQKVTNIELLGRIWGFLKYHHPAIAKGNYNWDYELFRFLPDYLKTEDQAQRDELLLRWIDKLGNTEMCESCRSTDDAFLNPDLYWIETSNMNRILKDRLHYIYQNRHQGDHYYVMLRSTGNPIFLHENNYANMPYPDAGFRLLALFRYWNMIYYFFPSKYLTDKDWNKVLCEYIPYFIHSKDELEYKLNVVQLIGEIGDSHAANLLEGGDIIQQLRGYWMAPFQVRFIENQLTITDYYARKDTLLSKNEIMKTTGLITGDIITHINGKSVNTIINSLQVYYPASNESTRMKNMAFDLLRSNQQTILVDYKTSFGQQKQKEIDLSPIYYLNLYEPDTVHYTLLDKNKDIGYINVVALRYEDIFAIKKKWMHTKGIILDIRCTPTTVGELLSSWFVSSETPFVKYTKGNPDHPGEFFFTCEEAISPIDKNTYLGKLVVLVNEETLSEGEYMAMMFRAGQNTTIIGTQTAGANGKVSDIFLPGGIKTWITGVGVYYPNGQQTQRVGIIPDIEVKPTVKGIQERRDELLEKAIEIIEEVHP